MEITEIIKKSCRVCGLNQPLENFIKSNISYDGYQMKCRTCYSGQERRNRSRKHSKVKEDNEFWNINEDGIYC